MWVATLEMSPLDFYHNFFEKNTNVQHKHFTTIFSVSKFNLTFPRTNYKLCYLCSNWFVFLKLCFVVTLLCNAIAIFLFTWLQDIILRFTNILQPLGDFVLRPLLRLSPGHHLRDFHLPSPDPWLGTLIPNPRSTHS